jgi:hypothetical protein
MCLSQVRLLEMVTPRYLLASTVSASSVWDPTNRKKIGNLEKVQKEQQDSFSIITQTEHLAVLLKW